MQSKIEQQVMAGVGVIYVARRLTSRVALEVYALIAAALVLWRLVWVHRVLQNFSVEEHAGLGATWNYAVIALEHAHTGVLFALGVAGIAALLLLKDAVGSLATPRFRIRYQ